MIELHQDRPDGGRHKKAGPRVVVLTSSSVPRAELRARFGFQCRKGQPGHEKGSPPAFGGLPGVTGRYGSRPCVIGAGLAERAERKVCPATPSSARAPWVDDLGAATE